MKQATFEGLAFTAKKKQTRREKFLTEMAVSCPGALEAVIEPHYPKAGRDAAHLLHAAVVCTVRSGHGGCTKSNPCAASPA